MDKMKLEHIPIDKLEVNWDFRTEPRDKEITEGIKQSIKKTGLVQLIKVRPLKNGKYEVVAGRGRLQELKKLGEKTIPVIVEDLTDEQAKFQSLIENIQRNNLSPMEMANAFKDILTKSALVKRKGERYTGYRWLSEKTGLTEQYIGRIMSLVEASEPIKKKVAEAVKSKKLSEDVAVEILSRTRNEPKMTERVLDQAIKKNVGKVRPVVRQMIKAEKDFINFEEALKSMKSAGLIDEEGARKKTPDDFVHELMDKVLALYYWLEPKVITYLSQEQIKRLKKELEDLKTDKIEPFLEELETSSL
jgi:ParB family chromosome partitioning protein